MKQWLLPIFDFLKLPKENPEAHFSVQKKIRWIFLLLLLEIPLMFLVNIFQKIPNKYGFINASQHRILKTVENGSLWYLLLIIVLIGPIFEELIFRLPLKIKKFNFIPLLVFGILMNGILLVSKTQKETSWLLLLPVLFFGIFALLLFSPVFFDKISKFLKSKYSWYFYFTTLVFALLHLFNYQFSWYLILFSPLLVLPQFIAGLLLGFIRNNFDFVWGTIFHILHNALFLLPIYLLMHPTKTELLVDVEKEGYKIEITQISSNNFSSDYKITPNEIYLKAPFKDIISRLKKTDVRNIKFKNVWLAEKHLRIHFINDSAYQSANTDTAIQLVLQNLLSKFDLELIKEKRWSTVWQLSIVNQDLFQNILSKTDSVTSTNFRSFYGPNDTITLNSTNSKALSRGLEKNFGINVNNQINTDYTFSIKVPNDNPKKLNNYFSENYGIGLKSNRSKIEFLVVK